MTDAPPDSRGWPRYRLAAFSLIVLMVQVGLIVWLAKGRTVKSSAAAAPWPNIFLPADRAAELPGVADPTLFVLPNRKSFSGPAWMKLPPREYHLADWTEPPHPLKLQSEQLGLTLREFVHANSPRLFEMPNPRELQPADLGIFAPTNLLAAESTVSVEGLVDRPLLSSFNLASQPSSEILKVSEVQVAVDADGRVFSPVLLKPGSGSKDADAKAVQFAKAARFQPLPQGHPDDGGPGSGLAWGKLIFHWRTIPAPPVGAASGPGQ